MPFHPDIAVRLPLLAGIPSLEAGLSEPLMRAQMEALMPTRTLLPRRLPPPVWCQCPARMARYRCAFTPL